MSEAPTNLASPLLLGPRGLERPTDAGYTLVGTLDGGSASRSAERRAVGHFDDGAAALVDRGGLVSNVGANWSLDWWIGADDRWYLPSREPTTRQARVGSGPIIETTMRIPSGSARQEVYGAIVGGRQATVVEIHNDSPVPVALALAVRPYPVVTNDQSTIKTDDLRLIELDDRLVRVGTGLALVLPRPPRESGGSTTIDLLADVTAGRDLRWDDSLIPGEAARSNGVFLYPLPHRTSLRCLVVGPTAQEHRVPAVSQAPDHEAVARGWSAVIDKASRFEFPDPALSTAMGGARARQLLGARALGPSLAGCAPGAGLRLAALALGGQFHEACTALHDLADVGPRRSGDARAGAEIVAAMGLASSVLDFTPAPELVETGVVITKMVERAGRRSGLGMRRPLTDESRIARWGLARLAREAGDSQGADQLLLPDMELSDLLGLGPAGSDEVTALLAQVSGAGSWGDDDAMAAARFVVGARSLLIDDSGHDLVLLPHFSLAWRGGAAEVHRAPTRHGHLSFAIRWHGARPALLWELDPFSNSVDSTLVESEAAVLRCPALDPDWVTTDLKGEALLAGSSEPLPAAPMPGDSFS